jgi:SET domain-containing protein
MSKEYYRPLPESLTISTNNRLTAETGRRQLGLYAAMNIPKGTILGITHFPNNDCQDGLIRTPLGGFFNHSENPNVEIISLDDGIRHMHTLKDIKGNDEITATYTTYNPTK